MERGNCMKGGIGEVGLLRGEARLWREGVVTV